MFRNLQEVASGAIDNSPHNNAIRSIMPILKHVDHAHPNGHTEGEDVFADTKQRSHNPLRMVAGGVGTVAGGVVGGVGAVAGGVGNMTQAAGQAVLGRDAAKGANVYVSGFATIKTHPLINRALTQMLRRSRKLPPREAPGALSQV